MTRFDSLFTEAKGAPIIYKGNTLISVDRFPVKNGDVLIASIEQTNANRRQGFVIDITGHSEMNGKIFKVGKGVRMMFWQDTMPKQVELKIFTKKDFVVVYNIWESTSSYLIGAPNGESIEKEIKRVDYFLGNAALIVEEIENGRRYRCNDGELDDDFDDIIFTIQKIKST